MDSFLHKIAQVIDQHIYPANELCVVFPNRRAGLFLKKLLVPENNKPRWVPQMLSVEDFIFQISGMKEPDHVKLLSSLYKVYSSNNRDPQSFDSFLGWGNEILKDFEEVDQYLVNPDKLFYFIRDAREIDLWKPGEEATEFEKNYLAFYESLAKIYSGLKGELLSENNAYQGLATRIVAENTQNYTNELPWKKVIFAGFNALTPAQLSILKYLISKDKAEIIFDADKWYLDDKQMEAGHFLRKYREDKELGEFSLISNEFIRKDRNIFTCGIPGNSGQARIAGGILKKISPEEYSDTAVVLADESLLLPVLNSLPSGIEKFNVTMGFPLVHTPLYALAESIFILHANAVAVASSNPAFYHKDVTSIIKNNQLSGIIDTGLSNRLASKIKSDNFSYIHLSEILEITKDYEPEKIEPLKLIFGYPVNSLQLLQNVENMLLLIKEGYSSEHSHDTVKSAENRIASQYSTEILWSIYKTVSQLRQCLEAESLQVESLTTLQKFFRETAQATKVPFYGEPLQGIQVMGMLETRVLDFKNIILLSVNEDTLPSAKTNKSFIPYDIRRNFGLPTHHERQSVFAYHFYRLLQRSINAWLIYNESEDTFGGGEKSRYIQQLEWELPAMGIEIKKASYTELSGLSRQGPLFIKKDSFIMEKLYEKAEKGFSFSSIKKFINCPLSFYFTYVLGLEEPDEVEEEISYQSMGTILHSVLEDLYGGFRNSIPVKGILEATLENADELIRKKTHSTFPALRFDSGRNLLFIKVAGIWLKRFMKDELKSLESGQAPTIIGVEEPLTRTLNVSVPVPNPVYEKETSEYVQKADERPHKDLTITLYGKIDRIEINNNEYRVIDYKTGKVERTNVKCSSVNDLFDPDKKTEKQLQLTLYKYLAENDSRSKGYEISPGIISFRKLANGFMSLESEISSEEFETHLSGMFYDMFDPEKYFGQNDIKNCIYCNFKQICNRNQ